MTFTNPPFFPLQLSYFFHSIHGAANIRGLLLKKVIVRLLIQNVRFVCIQVSTYETYERKCILESTHFSSQFTSINSLFKSPPRKLSSSTPPTPFLCPNLIGGSVSLIALHIFIYCILLHEQRLLNTLVCILWRTGGQKNVSKKLINGKKDRIQP